MTLFQKAFGISPKVKVLEFLLEGRELDYSITDIAEGAGIGRTTLFRIWKDLIAAEILVHTRDIGNAKLYRLNLENPLVIKLVDIFDSIVLEPLRPEQIKTIKNT